MEIKGCVHCFFEQSGTFKREFKKLGYEAYDYDIQNNYGETDYQIDLFAEIEKAYEGGASVFDNIIKDDLILAFFPCIYFCAMSQMAFYWESVNYRNLDYKQRSDKILERSQNREKFFSLAVKMMTISKIKGLRMVMENPWSEQTYLKANFVFAPQLVDNNRMKRGDYFVKPTAYWFVNCEHTKGYTCQNDKEKKSILNSKGAIRAGLCSEERSMISSDYARNFICDFILGKSQPNICKTLFDFG